MEKMNLTIRKLPKSVQTLICASNQINNYTKAVQELVFNALDADATSIAVRIHIAEGSIQVLDNGSGISQADFKYMGQNYMTSKLVDISTLKSSPNKYGFQGQSLANLAQISETLKVTSRFYKCETTCVKTFEKGRPKSIEKCKPRPSKGTTVEIKDFLYNLIIQKKSVDLINELQNIRTFLEHVSLVHSSISLSLRDDSKNEIVYKIHKNRDMYQTLTTLYEIEKANVQELQVEKNQYKVKAYVGKRGVEINRQFIFLNGKYINNSSLIHKKVNENFKKYFKGIKKIKKNIDNDEELLLGNKIPFYFIFITCPYLDYELTSTVLEFKDWGQIHTILDKLVKFYMGDTQLQVVSKNQIARLGNKHGTESIRNHIEKIMHRILGSNKPGISQMQNGVKGKLIKRKVNNEKKISKIVGLKKNKNRLEISERRSCNRTLTDKNNHSNDDLILEIRSHNTNEKENSVKRALTKKSDITKKVKPKFKDKTQKRLNINNYENMVNEQNNKKKITRPCSKKVSLNSKFAMETESVKRKCKMLAQQTEELIKINRNKPKTFINENVQLTRSNFDNSSKSVTIRTKINEIMIHEYMPFAQKTHTVDENVHNNINKLFKSNYDLFQTIICTHQDSLKPKEAGHQNIKYQNYSDLVTTEHVISKPKDKVTGMQSFKPCDKIYRVQARELNNSMFQPEIPDPNDRLLNRESKDLNVFKELSYNNQIRESDDLTFESDTPDYNPDSISTPHRESNDKTSPLDINTIDSNIRPYLKASDDTSPFQIVTFQSHNYERETRKESNDKLYSFYKKRKNFITTESKENFINFSEDNRFKTSRVKYSKLFKSNNYKRKINKSSKMFNISNNTFKGIRESYTIEFTESNDYECAYIKNDGIDRRQIFYSANKTNVRSNKAVTPSMSYIFSDAHYQCTPNTWCITNNSNQQDNDLDYEPLNRNTYTITNSYRDDNIQISLNHENWNNQETFVIESANSPYNNENEQCGLLKCSGDKNASNCTVFESELQDKVDGRPITDPIYVCETILRDHELSTDKEGEFDISFNYKQDSCLNCKLSSNEVIDEDPLNDLNNTDNNNFQSDIFYKVDITKTRDKTTEVSHHFTLPNSNNFKRQSPILDQVHSSIPKSHLDEKTISPALDSNDRTKNATIVEILNDKNDMGAFTLRNRMCFVPKGMSPIFEKCQYKVQTVFDPKEEYYAGKMYDDFVDKIQHDTEIFRPRIQDTSVFTTKDIGKVNSYKLNKDNGSLKFDKLCIKDAKVLGQVDSKFIAAIMKSKSHKSGDLEKFLVLFDQHAVHERIRLENNLADYLTGSEWKSVTIDEVPLKMSRDDILYLHNYRDKFTQYGLQWNILNYNEISVTAIPEGILGKNPRQVEKIIKAVKNLISEEIINMKMQRGCVSLYPKSIMDLVFSESCRYAIKFGDHLSKSQCTDLLQKLSDCKTPFQCAHGRPAMAVIMNTECNPADYKINFKRVQAFRMYNLNNI